MFFDVFSFFWYFFLFFWRNCQIRDARLSLVSSWNWSVLEKFWTVLTQSGQFWLSLDSFFGLEVTRGKLRSLQSELNLFLLFLLLMFLFNKNVYFFASIDARWTLEERVYVCILLRTLKYKQILLWMSKKIKDVHTVTVRHL